MTLVRDDQYHGTTASSSDQNEGFQFGDFAIAAAIAAASILVLVAVVCALSLCRKRKQQKLVEERLE